MSPEPPPSEPAPTLVGRAVVNPKATVEDAFALDMADLRNRGALDSPVGNEWSLSKENLFTGSTDSICFHLEGSTGHPSRIRFRYNATSPEGLTHEFNYAVSLESSPCRFGGRRFWFTCPDRSSPKCTGRCRIIYLTQSSQTFRCRECSRLSYTSRQRHRQRLWEGYGRHLRRLLRAEQELREARSRRAIRRILERVQPAAEALEGLDLISTVRSGGSRR